MEKSYDITFYYKDGHTEKVENIPTEEAAKDEVWRRITEDPSCCANIIIAEFDKETPNKRWVKMERYENRYGHIQRIDY